MSDNQPSIAQQTLYALYDISITLSAILERLPPVKDKAAIAAEIAAEEMRWGHEWVRLARLKQDSALFPIMEAKTRFGHYRDGRTPQELGGDFVLPPVDKDMESPL